MIPSSSASRPNYHPDPDLDIQDLEPGMEPPYSYLAFRAQSGRFEERRLLDRLSGRGPNVRLLEMLRAD